MLGACGANRQDESFESAAGYGGSGTVASGRGLRRVRADINPEQERGRVQRYSKPISVGGKVARGGAQGGHQRVQSRHSPFRRGPGAFGGTLRHVREKGVLRQTAASSYEIEL